MSNAYRVAFAISSYDEHPLGALSAQIAQAVSGARAAIGSTARMKCHTHTTGVLGHIYDLEFVQGEHALHPSQVEQAIYEQLRGYHTIPISQAMIDDDVCGDVIRERMMREVSGNG